VDFRIQFLNHFFGLIGPVVSILHVLAHNSKGSSRINLAPVQKAFGLVEFKAFLAIIVVGEFQGVAASRRLVGRVISLSILDIRAGGFVCRTRQGSVRFLVFVLLCSSIVACPLRFRSYCSALSRLSRLVRQPCSSLLTSKGLLLAPRRAGTAVFHEVASVQLKRWWKKNGTNLDLM
jgi:hypothetical protein